MPAGPYAMYEQQQAYSAYEYGDKSPNAAGYSAYEYGDKSPNAAGYPPINGADESATNILQSVKEQEAQFEQLTRELEAERQSVANQLEKCKFGSETASMSSISSTDESFKWKPPPQDAAIDEESDNESKVSGSQLVDSCLRVLQDRGLMGNIGEDPSEYLPRDHRQPATKYPPNNNVNQQSYNDPSNRSFEPSNHTLEHSNRLYNEYTSSGGVLDESNTSSMNGPTSVAMYERQSPNPAMTHHSMTITNNYEAHQTDYSQQPNYSYQDNTYASSQPPHDSRFLPNGEAGSPSYLAAPQHPDTHLQDGYQGLSFVEREPPAPEEPTDAPYEPLYMHSRHGDQPDNTPHYGSQGFEGPSNTTNQYEAPIPPSNQQGYDSFDHQFSYRDNSQLDYPQQLDPAKQSDRYQDNPPAYGQPRINDSYGPYGSSHNINPTLPIEPNGGPNGGLSDRLGQMQMDPDRYSDLAPSDSLRYNPHEQNNYTDRPNDSNFERPNDSFSGQGSGYYGGRPQDEDPYGNRQDLGYAPPSDRYNQSQPSPMMPQHHVMSGQPLYGDNHSQSPSSDRKGPQYSPNAHLNGPTDLQGSQSRFPPYQGEAVYDPNSSQSRLPPHTEPQYGVGRENYERQESSQYSRQNSMLEQLHGSQSRLAGSQSPIEAPLAQGSYDHLSAAPVSRDQLSGVPVYAAGSQSRLSRSGEVGGSQLRLVGAPAGSERGSQLQLPQQPYDNRAYEDDDVLPRQNLLRQDIPRQDSAILAQGGYNLELLRKSPSVTGDRRWRDPDLPEVIEYLSHPNPNINANAAAFLQHLCFMDDSVKSKTRMLGGVPALVELVNSDIPEVHRAACGALRNLSYGRANDENKKAIKNAGGIPALFKLLEKTPDNDVKELVTGILWNLSSLPELKKHIIEHQQLRDLVKYVLLPHSQMDRYYPLLPPADAVVWSTVFRNASGVLRNVSSDGADARKKLRDCPNLVDCTLYLLRAAIGQSDIDNKSVENCVCMLRNLSYACQEVQDPHYLAKREKQLTKQSQEATGCFGSKSNKKQKQDKAGVYHPPVTPYVPTTKPGEPVRGRELLWDPEVVSIYLPLLSDCTNPETLEAAAGAIQNLAACDWQPSVNIRAQVRKEKALPILVELLNLEADRVVCASATALRNLAIDPKNNELIGKYAMKQLVAKLPSEQPERNEFVVSNETVCAVEATIYEVIKSNEEHARAMLMQTNGIERLMFITNSRQRFSPKVVKFASTILYTLWQYKDMHGEYKKRGWSQQHFITKTMAAKTQHVPPGQPPPQSQANTLVRPSMGQSGPTAAGYSENTMAHVQRQQEARPYMGERTPQLDHRFAGTNNRVPPEDIAMQTITGSVHNVQEPNHSAGYYDTLQQQQSYPQDNYNGRQESYRSQRGYDEKGQDSYKLTQGSERGFNGGQNSYHAGQPPDSRQGSYRQAPPSEQGQAPPSEQGYPQNSYRDPNNGQNSYRAPSEQYPYGAPPSEQGAGPPSEQGGYIPGAGPPSEQRQGSYRQQPPSEQGSYRPGDTDPYARGPPSEHESYRPDPYAQVAQYGPYGGEDEFGRGPPDGVEPPRKDYVPAGGVALFPNQHGSQLGLVANEPLYAQVNKEKRRPQFPSDSNIGYEPQAYDAQVPPSPGGGAGGGGNQGADSWV